jgi:hypothetical protein
MLTIGQYLAPSNSHLPVRRYVHPDQFKMFEEAAYEMGFVHAAVGAMVRSSYHADQQAQPSSGPDQAPISFRSNARSTNHTTASIAMAAEPPVSRRR